MIPDRRSTSTSAASTSRRVSGEFPSRRFSSRSRSAASGVRSWCEASAAKSRCEATRRSSRPAIASKLPARSCTSRGPGASPTRVESSPCPRATADRRSRWRGPVMVRASTTPIAPTAAIPTSVTPASRSQ